MNNPGDLPDEYLPVTQAAKVTNLGKGVIYDRIETGELPAYRFGTGPRAPIRIKRSDLDRAMLPIVPKKVQK